MTENYIEKIKHVCAEAYQLLGQYDDVPVEALDNLLAAANGDPIPHESFLPFQRKTVTSDVEILYLQKKIQSLREFRMEEVAQVREILVKLGVLPEEPICLNDGEQLSLQGELLVIMGESNGK